MTIDEQAIRHLVATWHRATAEGDVEAVLPLMSPDAVFLSPGQPPMKGREAFAQGLRTLLQAHRIESDWEIQEIGVSGDLAYCWSALQVRVTPLAGGEPALRAGNALSVLHKQASGHWLLVRDANLLASAG